MPSNYDSKETKKPKAETLFIELVDQRDSGWVLDGTAGTKHETRITTPAMRFIPNRGFRLVKGINPETQKEEWYNEEIRYIKNQREISLTRQKEKGINPSRNKVEDKIKIERGNFSVAKEGAYIGLYNYILESFYNESNKDRPGSATAIYRVVELGKEEEETLDRDLIYADAIQYLGTLVRKQGTKYEYNEDRINSLCNLFLVYAETNSGKILGLKAHAYKDPQGFLDRALKFEQTIETNISHALELDVIKFDGNTAIYANKEKVVASLGAGNMKHEKKIEKLAEILGTDEMKSAYEELLIELEAAKETKNRQ